jgi:iron complex transport system ATP-binding protein
MLQLKNIQVGYGKKTLLQNINVNVAAENFVGVLGINGIGKSTLLKTIAGLIIAQSGSVVLNEKAVEQISIADKSALISVAGTERAEILYMTVREFVALGKMRFTNSFNVLSEMNFNHVEQVMQELHLSHLASKYIGEISDGEKQKAVIARAVAQDTPLMILDEPTAFLDFRNKRIVFEYLASLARNKQKIILASTHDLELSFRHCSTWWVIDEARNFAVCNDAQQVKEILKF